MRWRPCTENAPFKQLHTTRRLLGESTTYTLSKPETVKRLPLLGYFMWFKCASSQLKEILTLSHIHLLLCISDLYGLYNLYLLHIIYVIFSNHQINSLPL